jgi:hypothetical protein
MYGRVGLIELVLALAIFGFFIYCYWRIWSKAGFNGAWSLLMLVPIANIGSIIYLAFAKWPVHDRSSELKRTFD